LLTPIHFFLGISWDNWPPMRCSASSGSAADRLFDTRTRTAFAEPLQAKTGFDRFPPFSVFVRLTSHDGGDGIGTQAKDAVSS
jgi:hypothetical protein